MLAAEIHGVKWSDLNGNGRRDANDPGLPGVTIYIDADNDGVLDDGELRVVTAADNPATPDDEAGSYSFIGLPEGTYIVREVVPAGYEPTFPVARQVQFNIDVVFPDNSLTPQQQAIFRDAAHRWEQIIVADIPDVFVLGVGTVDDVVIEARGPFIDGPGAVLGQAGPLAFRTGSFLPAYGIMEFDSADIVELIADGQFDEVILHEMGHVLGIGTIWQDLGLLTGINTANPQFIGASAAAEYRAIFGNNAQSVPVEGDEGGSGTRLSHWDEATLFNELMTGFLNPNVANPLSRITVGQMADLGYRVNLDAADPYTAPRFGAAAVLATGDDVGALPENASPARRGRIDVLDLPRRFVDVPAAAGLPQLSEFGDKFWRVELADGEIVRGVDFGNHPLPGSISGRAWLDLNADGAQDHREPSLANQSIFLDLNGNGVFDHRQATVASPAVPINILDFLTISSPLMVENLPGQILDVNVTLDIDHTFVGDLVLTLISPAGTAITLAAFVGEDGNGYKNTTFDDEAPTSIAAGSAPFAGSFRPAGPLSALDGELAVGRWTLEISDEGLFDQGRLNSWSITLETGEVAVATDSEGNYRFPALPPGEYALNQVVPPDRVRTFPSGVGTHSVSLAPGQARSGVNFGSRSAVTGFLGGLVWDDYDANGVVDPGEPPLAGRTVFLDQNHNGVLDSGPATWASTEAPRNIVDRGTIESHVVVSGMGEIVDVDVIVNIQHTFDADLDVFLISPRGTRVELFTDVGGAGDNFLNTRLDDEAAASIRNGAAPFAGSFRPEGLLAAFDGEDPNGAWTLEVSDDSNSDVGVLLGWSLIVTTREQSDVTDANGQFGFANLPAGPFSIAEILPAGWTATQPAAPPVLLAALVAGEVRRDLNFGNRAGAIAGVVWYDRNRDGVRDPNEPGLPGQTVYLDANGNSAFDHGPATISWAVASQAIPDLGTIRPTITVASHAAIEDLNVTLSITHNFVADLDVFLVSPRGTRVELFTDLPGGGANLIGTTLDDEAATAIIAGAGPFAGSWRPEGSLADFDGEDPSGSWTLEITDDAGNDAGALVAWSLTITSHEVFAATDAGGRYVFHDLLPGGYVVRLAMPPSRTLTAPVGNRYALALALGEQRTGADFGVRGLAPLGDYDRDGKTDGNDFLVWQRQLGATANPLGSGADGDGDGRVTEFDLAVWSGDFGPASAAALDAALAQLDAAAVLGPLAYAGDARAAAARGRLGPHAALGVIAGRGPSSAAHPSAGTMPAPLRAAWHAIGSSADDHSAHAHSALVDPPLVDALGSALGDS
jgi:subtilisin-like proprotein convertase family protein